eukprot:10993591-Ditylum_brightwellii.AAC.1
MGLCVINAQDSCIDFYGSSKMFVKKKSSFILGNTRKNNVGALPDLNANNSTFGSKGTEG